MKDMVLLSDFQLLSIGIALCFIVAPYVAGKINENVGNEQQTALPKKSGLSSRMNETIVLSVWYLIVSEHITASQHQAIGRKTARL